MKFFTAVLIFGNACITANADCNVDEHHPENGGYFIEGVNGFSPVIDPESPRGGFATNSTWGPGIVYPYGQEGYTCKGPECSCNGVHEMRDGCRSTTITGHTCSVLRFCPGEGGVSGSIYQMPDFEATEKCNFRKAKLVGQTFVGPPESCYEYPFEEDHELKTYYFADRQGCEDGQKVAINIEDFAMTAIRCEISGTGSSRIKNCDCRREKSTTVLTDPCLSASVNACFADSPEDTDCCETETCLPRSKDYSDPIGKAIEDKRRASCDDDVPGNCYNEDGTGSRWGDFGSSNCCDYTCSECGIELSETAEWKPCVSSNYPGDQAACGYRNRKDTPESPFMCDFSKCDRRDHWKVSGEAYQKWATP